MLYVIKRDGTKEKVHFDKITKRIAKLCDGLDRDRIDPIIIAQKVVAGIYSNVKTTELDNLAAETAAYMTTTHPDYALLASRIAVSNLHKETKDKFSEVIEDLYLNVNEITGKSQPLVSELLYTTTLSHRDRIDASIDNSRDYDYQYFGFKTLERSYLLRLRGLVVERPQYLIMRVSLGIHGADVDSAIETYNLMSKRMFTHASPTLFNSGTPRPQLSSCFLIAMSDDSISGIYDTLKTCALISKSAGGIGLHVHNIRATGSYIAGTGGYSNGLVPMLRVYNMTARYVDQGGNKRPGAFAIYLEPWHADIFDFLDLKKNFGKEESRSRDLFYALWISDLFMRRVERDEMWTLFCPVEAPGLSDCWGPEFEALYESYEAQGLGRKIIPAQKLWYAILDAQVETGTPYMCYKDACNAKSNQKNLGTIKSSNLCTEIVQYSSKDEVAVCNLASIALPSFIKSKGSFDFTQLHYVTKVITRNLNNVININHYPVPEARNSNMKHRPIGIGVQGLADTFLKCKMPFDSAPARKLNIQIFETIYHAALEQSCELAQIHGTYESYPGCPVSQGILQFDMWNVTPSSLWDWDSLRAKISQYGIRNSLLVSPMPTASTSQILGFNECFEPYTSNIYTRRVLSGEFQIVNQHLLRDLIDLGLWNESMRTRIIADNGSIANITEIPEEVRYLYRTVWEISQKSIIDMAVDRGAFIDQSQSLNIHIGEATISKLTSMHFYGWKKGLKTGMYYLRTKPAAEAIKFTIDPQLVKNLGDFTLSPKKNQSKIPIVRTLSESASEDINPFVDESSKENNKQNHTPDAILACSLENKEACMMCSG